MKRALQFFLAVAAVSLLLPSSRAVDAQTMGEPEEFSAFAVNMGALTSGSTGTTGQLIMTVNRWTPPAERDELLTVVKEKGADALLRALQKTKRVGNLRTPQSVGYELRLALDEPGKDGGRRVILVTDRPVGFAEATNRPHSLEYPFTVIDMQLPAEGRGQGTMSLAAKIIPAGRTILVENYDTQPITLNRIEIRKLTRK
jgi:hypothetical protein